MDAEERTDREDEGWPVPTDEVLQWLDAKPVWEPQASDSAYAPRSGSPLTAA